MARLIWKESLFDPGAVSPKGAQGIAQFMPGTAKLRGLDDPFDPPKALAASAAYLAELRQGFGNLGLAAAAYNAGEERVRKWLARQVGLPYETQDYVLSITGHSHEEWKAETADFAIPAIGKAGRLRRAMPKPRHARTFAAAVQHENVPTGNPGASSSLAAFPNPAPSGLPGHPQPLCASCRTRSRWCCASATSPWAAARWSAS